MEPRQQIRNEGFIQLEPDLKLWHQYAKDKAKGKLIITGRVFSTESEQKTIRLEIETIIPPSHRIREAKTTIVLSNQDKKNGILKAMLGAEDFMVNKALLSDYWAL